MRSRTRISRSFNIQEAEEPQVDLGAAVKEVEEQPLDQFVDIQVRYLKSLYKRDKQEMGTSLAEAWDLAKTPSQRRFVEDNRSVLSLYSEEGMWDAAKVAKRLSSKDGATLSSVWSEVSTHVQSDIGLARAMFRIGTLGALRQDSLVKFICALTGAAQLPTSEVGGPDLIIPTSDLGEGIWASVRAASGWGYVMLGPWSPRDDDPERFLDERDMSTLGDGPPVEKAVMRKRVVLEGIASALGDHEYVIVSFTGDGTWDELMGSFARSIRSGYADGTVEVIESETRSPSGWTMPSRYDLGMPGLSEAPLKSPSAGSVLAPNDAFIEEREGRLWLTCSQEQVNEMAKTLGLAFSQKAWQAAPEDLESARSCRTTAREIIFRRCD